MSVEFPFAATLQKKNRPEKITFITANTIPEVVGRRRREAIMKDHAFPANAIIYMKSKFYLRWLT